MTENEKELMVLYLINEFNVSENVALVFIEEGLKALEKLKQRSI